MADPEQLPLTLAPGRTADEAPEPPEPAESTETAESTDTAGGGEPSVVTAPTTPTAASGSAATVEAGRAPARSFQASAGIQGRQFAEQCDTLLGHLGYELHGRRVLTEVGVEIDQEAVSPSGRLVWFEYKGSVQGNRPGLRRTDTLKKAVANGALLRALADPAPYVVITSHLPEAGSGAAMLHAALELRYLSDVVWLYDPAATARLARW